MPPPAQERIEALHRLYCELTGQPLSLRFDRQRLWFDWLRAGFDEPDLRAVILYLQKEIRHHRRQIGALKLTNLLQPDRFEEDLCISRARLRPPSCSKSLSKPDPLSTLSPEQLQRHRRQAAAFLADLKKQIR